MLRGIIRFALPQPTKLMAISVIRYSPEFLPSANEFDRRISDAGLSHFRLDLERYQPPKADRHVSWECWIAVEDETIVRGGFFLKRQPFLFNGESTDVGFYNLSISEGAINPKYSMVALKMLNQATALSPLLFALGMGGRSNPLPRFLEAMGWTLVEVPFRLQLFHPEKVMLELPMARSSAVRKAISTFAAYSGTARLGNALWKLIKNKSKSFATGVEVSEIESFEGWADAVWERANAGFLLISKRDSAVLNELYPRDFPRITRLKVSIAGRVVGWAVVRLTHMENSKHFGSLRVGSIVDCLSHESDAPAVMSAATIYLAEKGADLALSNQTHAAFNRALAAAGYVRAPSNFLFASSPALSSKLSPLTENVRSVHMNRGDGDGPINL